MDPLYAIRGFGRYTKTDWQDWIGFEDATRRGAREEDRTRWANVEERKTSEWAAAEARGTSRIRPFFG